MSVKPRVNASERTSSVLRLLIIAARSPSVFAETNLSITSRRYCDTVIGMFSWFTIILSPRVNKGMSSNVAISSSIPFCGRTPELVIKPLGIIVPNVRIRTVDGPLRYFEPRTVWVNPPTLEKSRAIVAFLILPARERTAINPSRPSTGSTGL